MAEEKSWRTTATGVISILVGLAFVFAAAAGLPIEGLEPNTEEGMRLISGGLGAFGIVGGLQGILSRDNKNGGA